MGGELEHWGLSQKIQVLKDVNHTKKYGEGQQEKWIYISMYVYCIPFDLMKMRRESSMS
jgi:hypothetical protein